MRLWIKPEDASLTTKTGLFLTIIGLIVEMKGLTDYSAAGTGEPVLATFGVLIIVLGSLISGILLIAWLMSWGSITVLYIFYPNLFVSAIMMVLSLPAVFWSFALIISKKEEIEPLEEIIEILEEILETLRGK